MISLTSLGLSNCSYLSDNETSLQSGCQSVYQNKDSSGCLSSVEETEASDIKTGSLSQYDIKSNPNNSVSAMQFSSKNKNKTVGKRKLESPKFDDKNLLTEIPEDIPSYDTSGKYVQESSEKHEDALEKHVSDISGKHLQELEQNSKDVQEKQEEVRVISAAEADEDQSFSSSLLRGVSKLFDKGGGKRTSFWR